jgi:hypothetical protein
MIDYLKPMIGQSCGRARHLDRLEFQLEELEAAAKVIA